MVQCCCTHKELYKILSFKANLTLKVKVKVTSFQSRQSFFKRSMIILSVKAKLQIGQFKSVNQIFCMFEGQFDLEGQGQGHQFLNPAEIFR